MILVVHARALSRLLNRFIFPPEEKRILLIINLIIWEVNNSFLHGNIFSEIRSFEVCVKSQCWEPLRPSTLKEFSRIIASYNIKKINVKRLHSSRANNDYNISICCQNFFRLSISPSLRRSSNRSSLINEIDAKRDESSSSNNSSR